jgi:polyhydroxyalkanoate synthesis regulator phasin
MADVIKEIVEKDELTVDEMIAVVTEYIWQMKQQRVDFGITYNPMTLIIEIQLLHKAYSYAEYYFKNGYPIQKPV